MLAGCCVPHRAVLVWWLLLLSLTLFGLLPPHSFTHLIRQDVQHSLCLQSSHL